MVINENNSYINSFTKGMNSDQAYDQLSNQNYTYAKNIRITKNQLIGDIKGDYSSVHEGIVTPVHSGIDINIPKDGSFDKDDIILASDTVDNLGVIITKNNKKLKVYRFEIINDKVESFTKHLETQKYPEIEDLKAVSIVLYKELDNVIKVYIATGIWPVFIIRVDKDANKYGNEVNIDSIINNRIMPTSPIYIQSIISGQLKTSQVQYTYRFYNKYGITTRLAPLTNKIQVIDSNRNKEIGNAENTSTTIGFTLKVNYTNNNFERMQIYRLQYINENENAEVSLIYDGKIQNTFNDVGADPLQTLTMEEFSSLSGIQIIPKIIENNQDYMFAANVTDDTIIKGLSIDKDEKQIELVTANVRLCQGVSDQSLPVRIGEQFSASDKITKEDNDNVVSVTDYISSRNINPSLARNTYNNQITSSLLRSLRRGETYKYGIVYYDNHGRRSDVLTLGDCEVPSISDTIDNDSKSIIKYNKNASSGEWTLDARSYGVKITLPQPKINGKIVKDIIGCQIVRRSSKDIYQKALLQVALARPVRQALAITSDMRNITYSPYYPTGVLTSDHVLIPGYYGINLVVPISYIVNRNGKSLYANSVNNTGLFQVFSSEIDFRRDDSLSKILQNDTSLNTLYILAPLECLPPQSNTQSFIKLNKSSKLQLGDKPNKIGLYIGAAYIKEESGSFGNVSDADLSKQYSILNGGVVYYDDERYFGDVKTPLTFRKFNNEFGQADKTSDHLIYNYYSTKRDITNNNYKIVSAADIKIPKWYEGFSNIQLNGDQIVGGIKQYKQYSTSVNEYIFNNWVSSGLYDLQIYGEDQPNVYKDADGWESRQFLYGSSATPSKRDEPHDGHYRYMFEKGYIGPGPSSLLVALDKKQDSFKDMITGIPMGTYICNIEHNIVSQNAEPDEHIQYFGFGNYFPLKLNTDSVGNERYYVDIEGKNLNNSMIVFDGDIYITPHEITTLYKAYDFNSKDTLESMQITNYVPMESKVNTFFDYGMNYLNTQSTNLLYESGSVEGITSQDRPAHQYNMIYSNNDVSNDVFSLISTDQKETNTFPHRTYYSEPKINGEFIDNFGIFKTVSFIDVDSKYGELTELYTDKNTLYYWQNTAFGRFSVNERSLINDQNGNTIMLGQAGILSRFDYINTKYGMRPYDYCAFAVENRIYWVDVNNRAVVVGDSKNAINLGEQLNVQNIINDKIDTINIPKTDYDLQNNEIIFKCLRGDGQQEQIVFNIKYNIATSIYNRDYDRAVYINNHMYGINLNDGFNFIKYNYIKYDSLNNDNFLSPVELSFIVNQAASTTKVFDSQTVIPIKRSTYNGIDYTKAKPEEHNNVVGTFFNGITTNFETDIVDSNTNSIEPHTDREGNIIYSIPRYGNTSDWGNRMRGKWLKTYMKQSNPHEFFTISHVITKLRQSYS